MSLSENEIIKALEVCASKEIRCSECPFDEVCANFAIKDLLAIINRLQADKEALIAGQETLQKALAERNAEIERLLTEFARLKEETTQPYLLINCDDKSVEALRKVVENQNAVFIPDNGATVEFLDKASIKAEAIKELIDKAGELTFVMGDEEFVYMSDIIKIGEEMVGDAE